MPGLPALIIGVGGTGLKVLQRVKERLIETYYGSVPPQITLLGFDTAPQSPAENFCGVQLSQQLSNNAMAEMALIQTDPAYTMDDVIRDSAGRPEWEWLERDKLSDVLTPNRFRFRPVLNRFRPVGRTALFLNYAKVRENLEKAMRQVMQPWDVGRDDEHRWIRQKRNIFIVGSFAGGTGAGAILDIAALIRSLKAGNPAFVDIQMIGIIVSPNFFADGRVDEASRLVANSYAGLRELDRFMLAHDAMTPYRFTGGDGQVVTMDDTLFDLCYLVDTHDYNGTPAGPSPELGALPAIADLIVAHTDLNLGLRLNAAHLAVRARYAIPPLSDDPDRTLRLFSSFNSNTIIFPREDVARSLSYQLLIEFIDTHLVPTGPDGKPVVPQEPVAAGGLLAYLANPNPRAEQEQEMQIGRMDMGPFIRSLLTKAAGGPYDTALDTVMAWLVEDAETRREAAEDIQRSIDRILTLAPTGGRLAPCVAAGEGWLETYLGPLVDANLPLGDRRGGEWDAITRGLVVQQRRNLEAYVQALVLRLLNQRDDAALLGGETTSLLRANRIGYALGVLGRLKDATREFLQQTRKVFGDTQRNLGPLRKELAVLAHAREGWFRKPCANYLRKLREVAEAERQHLLFNLTDAMAREFGGDLTERDRPPSVLDTAITELTTWFEGLREVRTLIAEAQTGHESQRKGKYAIESRSYITDPARFPEAVAVEEGLYARYRPIVWKSLLGPDIQGEPAFSWEAKNGAYFDYTIVTKHKPFQLHPERPLEKWPIFAEASGPEAIAERWREGGFRLMAEQVRNDPQARVAGYIRALYGDSATLINRALEPRSRALAQLMTPVSPQQQEYYLAVDYTSADQQVVDFYQYFWDQWRNVGRHSFVRAEGGVACSYVTFYHGLRLDQVRFFAESERSYREVGRNQGALHLFREERHAATYEAQLANFRDRSWWLPSVRLHPEVVVGLGKTTRVHDFALALVAGLIQDVPTATGPERTLQVGQREVQLTDTGKIVDYNEMGDHDRVAARLLQAFHAYTLLGYGVPDIELRRFGIPYGAVTEAVLAWVKEQHPNLTREQAAELVRGWEGDEQNIGALFRSERGDRRFRDLGLVLAIELANWSKTF